MSLMTSSTLVSQVSSTSSRVSRSFTRVTRYESASACRFKILRISSTFEFSACFRSRNSLSILWKVWDCKAKDADGEEVQITLWNEEIERVQPNDRIRISNGWVREWRGNMQVSAGKFGRLEVLK